MPEKVPDRAYVARGEFDEFRQETKQAFGRIDLRLQEVPTKQDISATITAAISQSRQFSPALLIGVGGFLISFFVLVGALYSGDQKNRDELQDAWRIYTDKRFAGIESAARDAGRLALENRERIVAVEVGNTYVEKMVREHDVKNADLRRELDIKLQREQELQFNNSRDFDVRIQREMREEDAINYWRGRAERAEEKLGKRPEAPQ